MDGQSRRGTRRPGRSRRGGSWPVRARAFAAASGSRTAITGSGSTSPGTRPATRATYRLLILKGLAPEEAANLTAFLCGIHVGSLRWKLTEINRLLFLRELQTAGRFGGDDGIDSAQV